MQSNYVMSICMFICGFILFIVPKEWDTPKFGLKTPFSLSSEENYKKANCLCGKLLMIGGPASAILCFIISLTPLNNFASNTTIYNSITVLIFLLILCIPDVYYHVKYKKKKI
ncbi:MAG: SdpI family protein [Clostridium sp.]|nr:SdpI family protein [Clostridium sp.]MDU7084929.1 SdpI family protein [Clostridium sp.]